MKAPSILAPDILAALLEAGPAVAPPPALASRVLARIGASLPATHERTLRHAEGWVRLTPLLDIKILIVDEKADSVSLLLRGAPGACVPAHGHGRYEECLVLQGEISIGGLRLAAGDYQCVGAGLQHPEIRTDTGALVFLRTALKDCPIPL